MSKADARRPFGAAYPWYLVGLLWLCGFFNYADRMAVVAVFPVLGQEFGLSKAQLGLVASLFGIVYGLSAPFAGFLVDRFSRRTVIAAGLAFWSLVCFATGTARSYAQLLFYRASEGLGESFYFPASMTLLADYHPPTSRSRAMSVHQTSVYLGTAGGVYLAGLLAERFDWRTPFFVLGTIGTVYAAWLVTQVVEPVRGKSDQGKPGVAGGPADDDEFLKPRPGLVGNIVEVVVTPSAALLLAVFVGANFVAMAFMAWLPTFLEERFHLGLASSSLTSTAWSLSSLAGVLVGGVLGDLAARRAGGRIRVQAAALLAAAPFVLAASGAGSVPYVVATLVGVGFCKGVYDASIFASLFDVVRPGVRGTAAGLMNTVGWTGGSLAPVAVGALSDRFGLGSAIGATAPVYVAAGLLALVASGLSFGKPRRAGP